MKSEAALVLSRALYSMRNFYESTASELQRRERSILKLNLEEVDKPNTAEF